MARQFRSKIVFAATIIGASLFTATLHAQEPAPVSSYESQRRAVNTNVITIIGSQAKSTYTRMAEDIQSILDDPEKNTIRILPILGRGGGQNFLDILFLKGISVGFVERDVIENFAKKNPRLYGGAATRLRYITKVSDSEMHFFVRHEIKKLADLEGKRVSFYKQNSSSAQAMLKIFSICELNVEPLYMDQDLAAKQLRSGELAGLGRISGAPHGALVNYTREDGHFLPLTEETLPPGCYAKLMKSYLPALLKYEHYPKVLNEGQTVPTVANSTILATYRFAGNSPRNQTISLFIRRLFDNINELTKEPRHPKWKGINVAATVPGWVRHEAAQKWIDENITARRAPTRSGPNRNLAATNSNQEEFFAQLRDLPEDQQKELLQQFLEFMRQNKIDQASR